MAIYARLENGTYAEVTGVYKTDGTEITEIFQGDRLVYSAINEIYGTVPIYYNGKGYDLTDYLISGNAVQDGTPSADAPVDAAGCGVRTGNLFDENTIEVGGLSQSTGEETTGEVSRKRSGFIPVLPNTQYTISRPRTGTSSYMWLLSYGDDKSYIGIVGAVGDSNTFVTGPQTHFLRWYTTQAYDYTSVMLNLGSTALPYEPYGFKLPLTVNGTEYPIYLGQVESTRRVKKLVLDGNETWDGYADGRVGFRIVVSDASLVSQTAVTEAICSHFTADTYLNVYSDISVTAFAQRAGSTPTTAGFIFRSQTYYTKEEFIQFLKDQYAAGTPVTVWYVLAEPETAIVNEPLMKIGDYADTISFAQAGMTIPTVSGANTLDMTSPVKPSEMYIKGKGIKQNRGQS